MVLQTPTSRASKFTPRVWHNVWSKVECAEPIRRRGLFLELKHTPPPPSPTGIGAQNRTIIVVKSISLIAILALHVFLEYDFQC